MNRIHFCIMVLWVAFCFTDLSVANETFIVQGKITDTDGNPVAGAEIFAYDSATIKRPADFISPKTGTDGRYSMILPTKKYWAIARVRSDIKYGPLSPRDRHSGEPVEIDPATGVVEMDFSVADIREAARKKQKEREDVFRLKGHITDRDGAPLQNVYVFARTGRLIDTLPEYISGWSGRDGSYILYVPAGKYFLGVASIYPPTGQNQLTQEISLSGDKREVIMDFQTQLPVGNKENTDDDGA